MNNKNESSLNIRDKKLNNLLLIKFISRNLFFSFSNLSMIFLFPITLFLAIVYLYSFSETFANLITIPSIMIGICVFSRIIYKIKNDQFLKIKNYNFLTLIIYYVLFSIIYTFFMIGIYILCLYPFWYEGNSLSQHASYSLTIDLKVYSPSLMKYLNYVNWGALVFGVFSNSVLALSAGFVIGKFIKKAPLLWIAITLIIVFILFTLPKIMPIFLNFGNSWFDVVKYLNPFTFSNNFILSSWNGQFDLQSNFDKINNLAFNLTACNNPFNLNENFFFYKNGIVGTKELLFDYVINTLNAIAPFNYSFIYLIVSLIISTSSLNKNKFDPNYNEFLTISIFSKKRFMKKATPVVEYDSINQPNQNLFIENSELKSRNIIKILKNKLFWYKGIVNFNSKKDLDTLLIINLGEQKIDCLRVKDIIDSYKSMDEERINLILENIQFEKKLNNKRYDFLSNFNLMKLYLLNAIFFEYKVLVLSENDSEVINQELANIIKRYELKLWIIKSDKKQKQDHVQELHVQPNTL